MTPKSDDVQTSFSNCKAVNGICFASLACGLQIEFAYITQKVRASESMISSSILIALVWIGLMGWVTAQSGTQISVGLDLGENLIYLLVAIFFAANLCTPVLRYIYVVHLESAVEYGLVAAAKAQRKFSERLSDAQRKASQSMRS